MKQPKITITELPDRKGVWTTTMQFEGPRSRLQLFGAAVLGELAGLPADLHMDVGVRFPSDEDFQVTIGAVLDTSIPAHAETLLRHRAQEAELRNVQEEP